MGALAGTSPRTANASSSLRKRCFGVVRLTADANLSRGTQAKVADPIGVRPPRRADNGLARGRVDTSGPSQPCRGVGHSFGRRGSGPRRCDPASSPSHGDTAEGASGTSRPPAVRVGGEARATAAFRRVHTRGDGTGRHVDHLLEEVVSPRMRPGSRHPEGPRVCTSLDQGPRTRRRHGQGKPARPPRRLRQVPRILV